MTDTCQHILVVITHHIDTIKQSLILYSSFKIAERSIIQWLKYVTCKK